MCLITTQSKAFTATEDITCYKVLKLNKNNTFTSLYQNFQYKPYTTYKSNSKIQKFKNTRFTTHYEIYGGCFHSYARLKDAEIDNRIYNINKIPNTMQTVIVKCIIPKGTKYYAEGTKYYADNGIVYYYASKSIKILHILE